MRASIIAFAVLLLTGVVTAIQQEKPADKPPRKGDRVLVRGCLDGSILESTETTVLDSTRTLASAVTFRLSGDKSLLKRMRQEENGKAVEITGILKSDLPLSDSRRGKQVGRTRIVVGVGSPNTMQQQGPPHIPVLEVKSYEPRVAFCGG
jgi:hypothetical protein